MSELCSNNSLKSDTVSGLWPVTAPLSSNVGHHENDTTSTSGDLV